MHIHKYVHIKVKCSRYRPGVAQRVGRGIALLFHDRGIRRGWVVSNTPRPHFTPGKDPVPILQKAGKAPGPIWTRGISRPHRDSIPDRPTRSQSLYRLSYPVHYKIQVWAQSCQIQNPKYLIPPSKKFLSFPSVIRMLEQSLFFFHIYWKRSLTEEWKETWCFYCLGVEHLWTCAAEMAA